MSDQLLQVFIRIQTERWRIADDERGEGVISAAIVVLIMAFLGVMMWVGFKTTMGNAQTNVDTQIGKIGT